MCCNTGDRNILTSLRDDPSCPAEVRRLIDRALAASTPYSYAGALQRARYATEERSHAGMWLHILGDRAADVALRGPTPTWKRTVLGMAAVAP